MQICMYIYIYIYIYISLMLAAYMFDNCAGLPTKESYRKISPRRRDTCT